MAYVFIEDFKLGLDSRRERVAGVPGSLWGLKNAHITRGGKIERRKKFVAKYNLPTGTFGFHIIGDTKYVFGSGAPPGGIPSGITYQRLQHPVGQDMTDVIWAESFDGQPYVIAEFADDKVLHFYGGTLVSGWLDGIVQSYFVDNTGTAEYLKTIINLGSSYTATRSGSVITITGGNTSPYTVQTIAENGEGNLLNNQTLVAATTQAAVAGVLAVAATGSFRVIAGAAPSAATGTVTLTGGGAGSVDSITVNGVEVLGAAVPYNTDLNTTATDVATQINSFTSSPEYTAAAVGPVITITAASGLGSNPNGFVIVVSSTTITTAKTNMGGGVGGTFYSVTVDGVEILGAPVAWAVSNSATATAIAAQITSYTSSPNYAASANGDRVTIVASVAGVAANGRVVGVTEFGDTAVADITNMSGGIDGAGGQAQIVTVTVGGTFEPGDRFTIKLTQNSETQIYGAAGNPEKVGRTALTFKTKIYSVVESLLFFSGVNSAIVWNRDDPVTPGANFINMASQDEGSQRLTVAQVYQGSLAVFSRTTVQIWNMSTDESENVYLQTLKNTGTRSPRSVLAYGDNDVFYLADSGVRSLRARDSSNAAFVSDVGTAIDDHLRAYIKTLSDAEIDAAYAVLEPGDDRYWLKLGSRIYVFSYFPGGKISAWSYYDTTDDLGGAVDVLVRSDTRLYARTGDVVYLYGGDNDATYPDDDEIVVEVDLPFLDAKTPGTKKDLTGFDMASTGTWKVHVLIDPNDETKMIDAGTIAKITYPLERNVVAYPQATHFAVKAVCNKAGPATISNMCIHYDDPNEAG